MLALLKSKIFIYIVGALLFIIIGLGVTSKVLYNKVEMLSFLKEKMVNNWISEIRNTWHWKTKYGNEVASSIAQMQTKEEIINSKDAEIQKLTENAKKMGIRIKDLQYMLSINFDTIIDTVVHTHIVSVPGEPEVRYYDTVYVGNSAIYHMFNPNDSTSHYRMEMAGTLYVYYEPGKKEGRWRIKNIFVARKRLPIISVTSDNPLINLKGVKMVIVGKKNKHSYDIK